MSASDVIALHQTALRPSHRVVPEISHRTAQDDYFPAARGTLRQSFRMAPLRESIDLINMFETYYKFVDYSSIAYDSPEESQSQLQNSDWNKDDPWLSEVVGQGDFDSGW